MAQLIQFNSSTSAIGANDILAGSTLVSEDDDITLQAAAEAVKELEAELTEHRYYLERKVEQRTEQLVRRITLLESCNATLCGKLAKARRDVALLRKQLVNMPGGLVSNG